MEREIYKNYADTIKNLLVNGTRRGTVKNNTYSSFNGINAAVSDTLLMNENKDLSLFNSLNDLNLVAGKKIKYHEKPGAHPDFSHLKTSNGIENHYITSMFIDIKNSTALFKKYEPIAVANITTFIQKVAMHTCWHFDGYVQRFHGDGLLIYFGGKKSTLQQSVNNAINAASFFSYFMKNDLKEIFSEQNIERLYTRIGIDTGIDKDVVWHLAGMKDCSEVTTCSLHTSLAAKMQNNADSNGIMLGDNVKNNSSLSNNLFSIKYDDIERKEDRYIFQIPEDNFNYTQWKFDWANYLKSLSIIKTGDDGKLYLNNIDAPVNSVNVEFLKENVQGYRPYSKG